jgi:hypothetical protein
LPSAVTTFPRRPFVYLLGQVRNIAPAVLSRSPLGAKHFIIDRASQFIFQFRAPRAGEIIARHALGCDAKGSLQHALLLSVVSVVTIAVEGLLMKSPESAIQHRSYGYFAFLGVFKEAEVLLRQAG